MATLRQRHAAAADVQEPSDTRNKPSVAPNGHSDTNSITTSETHIVSAADSDVAYALPLSLIAVTLSVLIPIRVYCALTVPIQDCDETFNYWEPTHYLVYGHGLQTWEYSPVYALRSYLYVLFHRDIITLYTVFDANKIHAFYALRVFLAVCSSLMECGFVVSVAATFRRSTAVVTVFMLAASAGMAHATVAYLPQTFTMYFILMCTQAWMMESYGFAIFFMGVAALIGWPFVAVTAAPLAIDILITHLYQIHKPIIYSIITLLVCLLPSILVDYIYYKKLVIAVINIALYNSTAAGGSGAQLYGVEPVSYYVYNLILNFNIMAPLALLSPLIAIIAFIMFRSAASSSSSNSVYSGVNPLMFLAFVSPMFMWITFMSLLPHKEERFLIVMYPIICFAAAYTVTTTWTIIVQYVYQIKTQRMTTRIIPFKSLSALLFALIIVIIAIISASRVAALVRYYDAPLHVYTHLYKSATANTSLSVSSLSSAYTSAMPEHVSVCVGKEWYRFPSHFFLPNNYRLRYIQSSFTGLLPRLYAESQETRGDRTIGTSIIPPFQNDQNRMESERLVDVSECEYIVDFDLITQKEPHYEQFTSTSSSASSSATGTSLSSTSCTREISFHAVYSYPHLDVSRSPSWSRAFYIPFLSDRHNSYRPYQLLQRKLQQECDHHDNKAI